MPLPTEDRPIDSASEETLHLLTAETALICLQILHEEDSRTSRARSSSQQEEELVGSKDRKTIQTLFSLVSSWGLEPAILSYDAAIESIRQTSSVVDSAPRLREVTEEQQEQAGLRRSFEIVRQELGHLFTSASRLLRSQASPATFVSTGLIPMQILTTQQTIATHLLGAALRICWGPGADKVDGKASMGGVKEEARDCITLFLKSLQPAQLLPLLSSVSSPRQASPPGSPSLPPIPAFVRGFATRLLSAQLLRREGIVALISSVMKMGEESSEEKVSPTIKLDRLATLLTSPPSGMEKGAFLSQHTIPALVSFVIPNTADADTSAVFAKVASYTLEKLAAGESEELVRAALEPVIWQPLLPGVTGCTPLQSELPSSARIADAVHSLEVLVLCSTSISSAWLSWLISPVVLRLWDMLGTHESGREAKVKEVKKGKVAAQSEQLGSILQKWLAVSGVEEVMGVIRQWASAQEQDATRIYFEVDERNTAVIKFGRPPSHGTTDLSALLSNISMSPHAESDDDQARALLPHLQGMASSRSGPSASLFTNLLSRAGRSDLASSLLPQLLESYLAEKSRSTTQAWYILQLIVELLDTFGEAMTKHKQETNNVLRFVNVCLGGDKGSKTTEQGVQEVQQEEEVPFIGPGGRSRGPMADLLDAGIDASTAGAGPTGGEQKGQEEEELDEDLIKTALDLLLSVLEGNLELAPRTSPLLRLIESKLSRYVSSNVDEDLRRVAKEARLVLAAREQATRPEEADADLPHVGTPASSARQAAQSKYEEALKLLQDPILPVRAHGLVLLKEIAAATEHPGATAHLLPSILEILLKAIGDEESYLYLNAISALKEVILRGEPYLSQILAKYVTGDASRQGTDERLRIGEALLAAIQHLAEGGAVYSSSFLPALLTVLRDRKASTTLKSSALTLLGTCVEAFPLAIASATREGYVGKMVRGCLDLLQLEMVHRRSSSGARPTSGSFGEHAEEEEEEDPTVARQQLRFAPGADDSTSLDSSYPQLRRGALLLLHLLIKGTRDQLALFVETRAREQPQVGAEGGWIALRLPGGGRLPSLSSSFDPKSAPTTLPPLLFPLAERSSGSGGDVQLQDSTRTTMQYLALEDDDALVRRMAREVDEELQALLVEMVGVGLGG
ncbi:hypothetical protein BCV69DRAFT_285150 [Microstroma glucosiphilum]|uniref:RNA polymerase II assembly factor Rtp1 C-terminal domain-containing protein n=1 Tax=Pseudomicrostroma glucosiphilum TaxID=1684307 RepID=A0A316U6E0_9BASI|nr:hypothetical protein BCV69DRAFT_285150 [Pseudomicrostroma glucosiphilum]PWN18525.1 hypothetical protein BCV69DRAFT_285150 [Pseudomicrostroma glucosiphilum]